jgi:hypothetical protein
VLLRFQALRCHIHVRGAVTGESVYSRSSNAQEADFGGELGNSGRGSCTDLGFEGIITQKGIPPSGILAGRSDIRV